MTRARLKSMLLMLSRDKASLVCSSMPGEEGCWFFSWQGQEVAVHKVGKGRWVGSSFPASSRCGFPMCTALHNCEHSPADLELFCCDALCLLLVGLTGCSWWPLTIVIAAARPQWIGGETTLLDCNCSQRIRWDNFRNFSREICIKSTMCNDSFYRLANSQWL